MYKNNLLKKINNKKLNIGILGVGYVGIKLVLAFSIGKNKIYCFDQDKNKIKTLTKLQSPFSYIKDSEIKKASQHLMLDNKFSDIAKCDAIIICLPTPLKNNKPDLSHLLNGWKKIKPFIRSGQIIILESTTYPGCTEDIFGDYLKKKFLVDKNIFLSYSPERENPGDKNFGFHNTPKVISGIGKNSLIICKMIYKLIVNDVKVSPTIKVAEASKLLENIYRSVNIALINEIQIASHYLKINILDVINLAATKPFGFQKFLPGPGTGGHCIPIDPLYFSWLSKKNGFNVKFIELSAKINKFRTKWVISRIKEIINKLQFKKIKVLLLGLAYKKNIEDTRESASVNIFENLKKTKNVNIDFCDPYLEKHLFKINKKTQLIKSVKYSNNVIKRYDCIIIATDHDIFDYKKLFNSRKQIIDLRARSHKIKNKNIIMI